MHHQLLISRYVYSKQRIYGMDINIAGTSTMIKSGQPAAYALCAAKMND